MAENGKACPVPGCGRTLRITNTRGVCTPDWNNGYRLDDQGGVFQQTGQERRPRAAAAPRAPSAGGDTKDVRRRFMVLTQALGLDGERMVADFMEGWLDDLRAKVDPDDMVPARAAPAAAGGLERVLADYDRDDL